MRKSLKDLAAEASKSVSGIEIVDVVSQLDTASREFYVVKVTYQDCTDFPIAVSEATFKDEDDATIIAGLINDFEDFVRQCDEENQKLN